jgi:orotate phosphoribosyltransferase
VIGPELGAIILAHEVADQLTHIQPSDLLPPEWGCVRNIYAEKKNREQEGTPMVIKRGFDKLISGRKVLVTEDILSSGGSARRTIEAVRELGGEIVGLGVLCNRGNVKSEAVGDVPIEAIFEVQMPMYPEEECPICAEGKIPVRTDLGKGTDFLKRKEKKD